MKHVLLSTMLAVAAVSASAEAASVGAGSDRADTQQVTVRLLAEQAAVEPGMPVVVGLHFDLAQEWHVYWQNPGESGEPPSVQWRLPDGFEAGPLAWPAPERIEIGGIVNYAYAHEVLLPATIRTAEDIANESIELGADVSWLVCRAEECIPGQATLWIELPVTSAAPAPDPAVAAMFARARASIPEEIAGRIEQQTDDEVLLSIALPAGGTMSSAATATFYPLEQGIVGEVSGAPLERTGDGVRMVLTTGEGAPDRLDAVSGLVLLGDGRERQAYLVHADAGDSAAGTLSVGIALALAFAGGLLLNLMPCVFPVLWLKVLNFIEQAESEPRQIRLHGWAFTAGVVIFFWLLAGLLIALRAGGRELGWGFQLQSPMVLAVLCAVLLALALSLSGVFEIGLWMTTLGNGAQRRRGYSSSFWTGALATVVATPCTAPFMGAALGYALTQPASISMLVFTALAIGMASPYLLLSYFPAALSRLPGPGAWMTTLRELLAFPLYATVLWLLWVLAQQTDTTTVWQVMSGLLAVSLGAWLWGHSQRRRSPSLTPVVLASLVAAAGLMFAITAVRNAAPGDHVVQADEFWSPWSPEAVMSLQASGRPVFVNFTADWCLSCQVNERVVFSAPGVRTLFQDFGVVALKADWTREDERITRALGRFGRDGVPLYVFYPGRAGARPVILPQIPTEHALRQAFESEARQSAENRTARREA